MTSQLDAYDLAGSLDAIDDESDSDTFAPSLRYGISFFGVDLTVREYVRRLNEGEISILDWGTRPFWSIETASAFVESIILGLPVPEIFLAVEWGRGDKCYVIDGQRRLRALQAFYSGTFPTCGGKFKLAGVDSRVEGLAYNDLRYEYRRQLDDYLIHATVVTQDSPADGYASMYQMFKRLNVGNGQVCPHEIRRAVYPGALIDLVGELNEIRDWRLIIGKPSPRLKDQEMILRFIAMLYQGHEYARPMSEFLNVFAQENMNPDDCWIRDTARVFDETIKLFADAKGKGAFRLSKGRAANAAVFDSMSVGLASAIMDGKSLDNARVRQIHDCLLLDDEYLQAVAKGTSRERSVAKRLRIAKVAFANA